jgi:hypothetical protein
MFSPMASPAQLPCDGCGQLADSLHFSRRLRRLEWATRFRPIHVHALLLGGIAPQIDDEFLYNPRSSFQGEARTLLDAVPISSLGRSPEEVLADFQKLSLMLAHVLECPLDPNTSASDAHTLIEKQLPAAIARVRRSFKPKRVLLFSAALTLFAPRLTETVLGCSVFPGPFGVFFSSPQPSNEDLSAFRFALGLSNASAL